MPHHFSNLPAACIALVLATAPGCRSTVPIEKAAPPAPLELTRTGDEIVIAGRFFHTGAPVVLWTDTGGYDAYRTEKRFVPFEESQWTAAKASPESPARFGLRYQNAPASAFTPEQLERVRGGGWDLDLLREKVDQFVIHYDVCGTSRQCFRVLHDMRGLSVHFMLDIDGTIYQSLDVKERAWHATTSNDRSVGIEIANIGAYPVGKDATLDRWYAPAPGIPAGTIITLPASMGDGGVKNPGPFSPSRPERVIGEVQGGMYAMYDLTPQQYDSLAHLTATLCRVLPKITCDFPRDGKGNVVTHKLPDDQLAVYQGVLGHFHIQHNKTDPGPAFRWDKVVSEAREIMARTESWR